MRVTCHVDCRGDETLVLHRVVRLFFVVCTMKNIKKEKASTSKSDSCGIENLLWHSNFDVTPIKHLTPWWIEWRVYLPCHNFFKLWFLLCHDNLKNFLKFWSLAWRGRGSRHIPGRGSQKSISTAQKSICVSTNATRTDYRFQHSGMVSFPVPACFRVTRAEIHTLW